MKQIRRTLTELNRGVSLGDSFKAHVSIFLKENRNDLDKHFLHVKNLIFQVRFL